MRAPKSETEKRNAIDYKCSALCITVLRMTSVVGCCAANASAIVVVYDVFVSSVREAAAAAAAAGFSRWLIFFSAFGLFLLLVLVCITYAKII